MHDSGKREQFETGAVRDAAEDKPRIGLVSPFAMRRLGAWLTLGAKKYDERNWEKGMPFSRVIDSLMRHVAAFQAGETGEDHLAAIMCNAMFLMHYQDMIDIGVLPESLDDMPRYAATLMPETTPAFKVEHGDPVVWKAGMAVRVRRDELED